ncbi:Metalloenzyme, LuxS/M16 peptidase-like protein [Infundibulicybe gibba]|nr:Metalloenzyme, LuxS/M16 peptidase-like protein [Infundibulicybe gibba]
MLAARVSTARRLTRSFATVVDTTGLKVAAIDNNQPTAAVTFLIKAGSRFETKPGVAHALKNFAFKSTAKRSALGTVRESELYGGVLSATLSREHLALTAEFLRGDEIRYTSYEGDVHAASSDPATRAIELAHALAFRSGLGSSLFAPAHNSITVADIKSFAASAFTKGNTAIVGTGINQSTLTKLVEQSLGSAAAFSTVGTFSTPTSTYFGGETRVDAHNGSQTVFIGYGVAGAPSAELAALAAHLSPAPSVKWSQGISTLATSLPQGTSVQSVYLPYSDATLVGLLVQGSTAAGVKEAGKAAVQALKGLTAPGGVKADDLKKAVAKAKFAAASAIDSRDGVAAALGSKLLAGSEVSLESTLSSLDAITATGFSQAASSLLKGKPTYVALGDVQALPHADELGL